MFEERAPVPDDRDQQLILKLKMYRRILREIALFVSV